jgi:hypothetical protein
MFGQETRDLLRFCLGYANLFDISTYLLVRNDITQHPVCNPVGMRAAFDDKAERIAALQAQRAHTAAGVVCAGQQRIDLLRDHWARRAMWD